MARGLLHYEEELGPRLPARVAACEKKPQLRGKNRQLMSSFGTSIRSALLDVFRRVERLPWEGKGGSGRRESENGQGEA